ncbi:MAG TPA: DegT/DnrJ/EryC1/StrS family aminotransferase [Armatimonadota bacterium]|nr:DegT/DnrJ/EryC1/StrS family aminotransferase [Armatimonadota bacterium]
MPSLRRTKLAIHGGPQTVTMAAELAAANRWPNIGDEERAAVDEAMNRDDVYAPIAEFERDFAHYHDANFALAQNNGTSTLHSAYFAVGVEPGDEVLCPAYTWHLSVSQVLALHAIPVFCDVDPVNGCILPEDIERKISPYTKAINVLHPYGAVAPMDEIMAVARKHGLPVIEDCSHAHGALYRGKRVGTIGDIGCFSLQASKLMMAVEGGVLITDNEEYFERAVVLGHYERIPRLRSERYRKYCPGGENAPTCFGYKYRIHPWAAALARVQLRKLDEANAARRRNLEYLSEGLTGVCEGFEPPAEAPETRRTWLSYICQYHADRMGGVTREEFADALSAEGLPATRGRAGYAPVYWNPLYEERNMWAQGCPFDCAHSHRRVEYRRGDCPEAEAISRRTIGLPAFPLPCDRPLLDQCIEAVAKVGRNLVPDRVGR